MKTSPKLIFKQLNLLIVFAMFLGLPANALAAPVSKPSQPQAESKACNGISNAITHVPPTSQAFKVLFKQAVDNNCGKALDYGALVNFYLRTNGPQWTNHSKWLTNGDYCSWYGVTCIDGRVTGIALEQNNLTGTLPADLGLIHSLNILSLTHNQLTGLIPLELGELAFLSALNLSDNKLVGPIPPKLGNLINLSRLDLSENQLTGGIPPVLGNLSLLTRLNLGWNQLGDSIPVSLGNLPGLETLILAQNQLTGPIPSELGNLWNLITLNVSGNQLTGTIPPVFFWHGSLQELILSNNQLNGEMPFAYRAYNLKILDLGSNRLAGTIPVEITALGALEVLDLSDNQFRGTIPPEFGYLTSLKELILSNNSLLYGGLPVSLSVLPLDTLSFDRTGICQPDENDFTDWLGTIPNFQGTGITCNIPVIILPGVLGSKLYNNTPSGCPWDLKPQGEVWLDRGKVLAAILDRTFARTLAFQNDGRTPFDSCTNVRVQPETDLYGVQDSYKPIIEYLTGQGYVVKLFPYDFRMRLDDIAVKLDQQINAWGFDQVYLVGHSMGGLLARTYIQKYPQKVAKVISVGSPYLGAPKMAYRMRSGEIPLDYGDFPVHLTDSDLWLVMRNSPGMMQLIPSDRYFAEASYYYYDNGEMLPTYDATTTYFVTNGGAYGTQNGSLITEAQAYHQIYDDFSDITTEYYILSAINHQTIFRVNEQGCILGICGYVLWKWDYGDGTVPVQSATSLWPYHRNVHIYPSYTASETNADHEHLIQDALVVFPDVRDILLGKLESAPAMQAMTMAVEEPQVFIQLTVNGVAGVTVTDGAGNISGVDVDGVIANNVPGVTVEVMQNQIDIVLPADQTYSVTIQQNGDLPLKTTVTELTSSVEGIFGPSQQVLFDPIVIGAGGSASLLLDLSNGLDALPLFVDQNGDGQTDQTILPVPMTIVQ